MKTALVGYTGFVGSNIDQQGRIDHKFNSQNIEEAYGLRPDVLIYAGIRAEKYLANSNPNGDLAHIKEGIENIKKINPIRLVLISTIDVYPFPVGVDEDSDIKAEVLQPYGANRYYLEQQIRTVYPNAIIVRLPGLFGKNLKKNFIYDYINKIPTMIKTEKYDELRKSEPELELYYIPYNSNFFKCRALTRSESKKVEKCLDKLNFSALNFTDSRAVFQFYNLEHLWQHIQMALKYNLKVLNLATEPIKISELYTRLTGSTFINEIMEAPPVYDFKTKYSKLFDGENGYIYDKATVLQEIVRFVKESH